MSSRYRAGKLALATMIIAGLVVYLFIAHVPNVGSIVIPAVVSVTIALMALPEPAPRTLEDAARELASAVRPQWERIASERRLRYPTAPVRLVASTIGVEPPGVATRPRFGPLPDIDPIEGPAPATADISQLLRLYGGLGGGRIVLMGGVGAGKSSALILLLLDALDHRDALSGDDRARTPVPVLFTLTGWDPTKTALIDWLADRMATEYPFLKASDYPADSPRELLTKGKVAVLMDGLDELPGDARVRALQAVNDQAPFRFVLATRTEAMGEAVAAGPLFGAVAFALAPLTNTEAADYLTGCWRDSTSGPWAQLVEHVRTPPETALTQALATPLMLSLVRDNYAHREDMQPLRDLVNRSFVDVGDAENYLLDKVVDAAYTPRPAQRRPRYTVEQANRWLAYAAHEMKKHEPTKNLAWWRIREWRPPTLRFQTTALMAGLGPGLVVGLASGHHVAGPVLGGAMGAGGGALLGSLVARRIDPKDSRAPRQLCRIQWSRLLMSDKARVGVAEGRVDGLVLGLISGVVFGFVYGFGVGRGVLGALAATLVGGLAGAGLGALAGGFISRRVRSNRRGPRRWGRPISRDNMAAGLVFAIVGGVAGRASALGFSGGVVFGLGVWLIMRFIFLVLVGVTTPSADLTSPIDPITCWRRDRSYGLLCGLAFGLVFGVVTGAVLVDRAGVRPVSVAGLLAWVAVWSVIGLGAGRVYSSTWSAALTFLDLHRRGVAPLRMLRFLEDAHKRGVLRTAGPVYQFRHSQLQVRLAEKWTEAHPAWQQSKDRGRRSMAEADTGPSARPDG